MTPVASTAAKSKAKPRLPAWTRRTSLGMAVLFFYVNILYGAVEPASQFWRDRRAAAVRLNGGQEPPAVPGPAPSGPVLIAQLPSIAADVLSRSLPASARSLPDSSFLAARGQLRPAPALPSASLPRWVRSIPSSIAHVKEIHLPRGWKPSDGMVVHIQDAHAHAEAQANIARILESLAGAENAGLPGTKGPGAAGRSLLVGIEGARGPLNFTPYRTFPVPAIMRKAAGYMLKTSLVTGAEFVGMTYGLDAGDFPFSFWGVEDEGLYLAHVRAFKQSVFSQEEAKGIVEKLRASLQKLKAAGLNPDLRTLDENVLRYRRGGIGLADYVRVLAAGQSRIGPELGKFLAALELEKTVDYPRVEAERKSLTGVLAGQLRPHDMKRLAEAGLAYRLGGWTHGDFYHYFRALCGAYRIDLARWPQMETYVRYVLVSDSIKAEGLFAEIESLEEAAVEARVRTPGERELMKASQDLSLVEKLVAYELSPGEWESYRGRREEVKSLPRRVRDLGENVDVQPEALAHLLALFESFNDAAIARDGVLVGNLLARAERSRRDPAVLIAGGFHTDGITRILRGKNVAYAVLAPRLGNAEGGGTGYLDVFRRDRTPLEKLFTGERITLAAQGAMGAPMGDVPVIPAVERGGVAVSLSLFALDQIEEHGFSRAVGATVSEVARLWFERMGAQRFQTIEPDMDVSIAEPEVRDGKTVANLPIELAMRGTVNGRRSDAYLALNVISKKSGSLDASGAVLLAEFEDVWITVSPADLSVLQELRIEARKIVGEIAGSDSPLNAAQANRIVSAHQRLVRLPLRPVVPILRQAAAWALKVSARTAARPDQPDIRSRREGGARVMGAVRPILPALAPLLPAAVALFGIGALASMALYGTGTSGQDGDEASPLALNYFKGPYEKYVHMDAAKFEALVLEIKGVRSLSQLSVDERREVQRFQEALPKLYEIHARARADRGDTHLDCGVYSAQAVPVLLESHFPVKSWMRQRLEVLSGSTRHVYLEVSVAGRRWLVDVTADQYEPNGQPGKWEDRFHDLGVVVVPRDALSDESLSMYTTGLESEVSQIPAGLSVKMGASLLEVDDEHLPSKLGAVRKSPVGKIQVQVIDGKLSAPHRNADPDRALRRIRDLRLGKRGPTDPRITEAHLMAREPRESGLLDRVIEAGPDHVVLHRESFADPEDLLWSLRELKRRGVGAGLALFPDTPLERVLPFFRELDSLLFLTAPDVHGGARFDDHVLDKISAARRYAGDENYHLEIGAAGAIDEYTLRRVIWAGANAAVADSAIVQASSPERIFSELFEIVLAHDLDMPFSALNLPVTWVLGKAGFREGSRTYKFFTGILLPALETAALERASYEIGLNGLLDSSGVIWPALGLMILIASVFALIHPDTYSRASYGGGITPLRLAKVLGQRFAGGLVFTTLLLLPFGYLLSWASHSYANFKILARKGFWKRLRLFSTIAAAPDLQQSRELTRFMIQYRSSTRTSGFGQDFDGRQKQYFDALGDVNVEWARRGEKPELSLFLDDRYPIGMSLNAMPALGRVLAASIAAGGNPDVSPLTRLLDAKPERASRHGKSAAIASCPIFAARIARGEDPDLAPILRHLDDAEVLEALVPVFVALVERGKTPDLSLYAERSDPRSRWPVHQAANKGLASVYAAMIRRGDRPDLSSFLSRLEDTHALALVSSAYIDAGETSPMSRLSAIVNLRDPDNVNDVRRDLLAMSLVWEAQARRGLNPDLRHLVGQFDSIPDLGAMPSMHAEVNTVLGKVWAAQIRRGESPDFSPLLRLFRHEPTWTVNRYVQEANLEALGEVFTALIEQGREDDVLDWVERYRHDTVRAEILGPLLAARLRRGENPDLSLLEKVGPAARARVSAAIASRGSIMREHYQLWVSNDLPFFPNILQDYLSASNPKRFMDELRRRSQRLIQDGFKYDSDEEVLLAYIGVRFEGEVEITFNEFVDRVNDMARFDRQNPGSFLRMFQKAKSANILRVSSSQSRQIDAGGVNAGVLDSHLERLRSVLEAMESLSWLETLSGKTFEPRNLYFQLMKTLAVREGRLQPGDRFRVDFPFDPGLLLDELAAHRTVLYEVVFKLVQDQLQGNRSLSPENRARYLDLMRDLVIAYALSDRALLPQMASSDAWTRILGFKNLYEDYANHLPNAVGFEIAQVRGLKESIEELSAEIYTEINKVAITTVADREAYTLVPQGFLSAFRGRAGIVDCSFDKDKGAPYARSMHEDTQYYFVYKGDELKGYIGLLQGKTADGERVLTVDTINSPSLDGEDLLGNLFLVLDQLARDQGSIGIALPAPETLGVAFNFDNKRTIAKMDAYRQGRDIEVSPIHDQSWQAYSDMFGRDVGNSIEKGKFRLLNLALLKKPAGTARASTLGEKYAGRAAVLEPGWGTPVANAFGHVTVKAMARLLTGVKVKGRSLNEWLGGNDRELMEDVGRLPDFDRFTFALGGSASISFLAWVAQALTGVGWVDGNLLLFLWAALSGISFSKAHPEIREDGSRLTLWDRAVLFAVGFVLAGATVAPAVLFLAGTTLGIPYFEGASGLPESLVRGLAANVALHGAYNFLAPYLHLTRATIVEKFPHANGMFYQINAMAFGTVNDGSGEPVPGGASYLRKALPRIVAKGYDNIYLTGLLRTGRLVRNMSRGARKGKDQNTDFYTAFDPATRKIRMRIHQPWPGQPHYQGSPFAAADLRGIHPRWGTMRQLESLAREYRTKGVRLFVDFVSNHMGIDNPWIIENWKFTIHRTPSPEELALSDVELMRLYNPILHNDKGQPYQTFRFFVFYTVPGDPKSRIMMAHGRDPRYEGWVDTVQLDYTKPETRRYMLETIRFWAEKGISLRPDMANLVTRLEFKEHWYNDMPQEQFDALWPVQDDFWAAVAREVLEDYPDFRLVLEAYGESTVSYFAGLHPQIAVYDKRILDLLTQIRRGLNENHNIAWLVGMLKDYLLGAKNRDRRVYFDENHDDPNEYDPKSGEMKTAKALLGNELAKVASLLIATVSGVPFVHDRQVQGYDKKISILEWVPKTPGRPDPDLASFHDALAPVAARPVFRLGDEYIHEDRASPYVLAYSRLYNGEEVLVVLNFLKYVQEAVYEIHGEKIHLKLPGHGYQLLERKDGRWEEVPLYRHASQAVSWEVLREEDPAPSEEDAAREAVTLPEGAVMGWWGRLFYPGLFRNEAGVLEYAGNRAWFSENLLSLSLGLFLGTPFYMVFTQDLDFSLRMGYLTAWLFFFFGHFLDYIPYFQIRAPPANLQWAAAVSAANLALAGIVFFLPLPVYAALPPLIIVSFPVHERLNAWIRNWVATLRLKPGVGFAKKTAYLTAAVVLFLYALAGSFLYRPPAPPQPLPEEPPSMIQQVQDDHVPVIQLKGFLERFSNSALDAYGYWNREPDLIKNEALRQYIRAAARHYGLPERIGFVILRAELTNMAPFEDFLDRLALRLRGYASQGWGQVNTDTARALLVSDSDLRSVIRKMGFPDTHWKQASNFDVERVLAYPPANYWIAMANIRGVANSSPVPEDWNDPAFIAWIGAGYQGVEQVRDGRVPAIVQGFRTSYGEHFRNMVKRRARDRSTAEAVTFWKRLESDSERLFVQRGLEVADDYFDPRLEDEFNDIPFTPRPKGEPRPEPRSESRPSPAGGLASVSYGRDYGVRITGYDPYVGGINTIPENEQRMKAGKKPLTSSGKEFQPLVEITVGRDGKPKGYKFNKGGHVAADIRSHPIGSRVRFKLKGPDGNLEHAEGVVEDQGSAVQGWGRFDIGFEARDEKGNRVRLDYFPFDEVVPAAIVNNVGGILLWVKDPVVALLARVTTVERAERHYDRWIGPLLENLLALLAGGAVAGIPVYLLTADLGLAARAAYLAAWPAFVLGHTPAVARLFGKPAPAENLRVALAIAAVNLAAGLFAPLSLFLPLSSFLVHAAATPLSRSSQAASGYLLRSFRPWARAYSIPDAWSAVSPYVPILVVGFFSAGLALFLPALGLAEMRWTEPSLLWSAQVAAQPFFTAAVSRANGGGKRVSRPRFRSLQVRFTPTFLQDAGRLGPDFWNYVYNRLNVIQGRIDSGDDQYMPGTRMSRVIASLQEGDRARELHVYELKPRQSGRLYYVYDPDRRQVTLGAYKNAEETHGYMPFYRDEIPAFFSKTLDSGSAAAAERQLFGAELPPLEENHLRRLAGLSYYTFFNLVQNASDLVELEHIISNNLQSEVATVGGLSLEESVRYRILTLNAAGDNDGDADKAAARLSAEVSDPELREYIKDVEKTILDGWLQARNKIIALLRAEAKRPDGPGLPDFNLLHLIYETLPSETLQHEIRSSVRHWIEGLAESDSGKRDISDAMSDYRENRGMDEMLVVEEDWIKEVLSRPRSQPARALPVQPVSPVARPKSQSFAAPEVPEAKEAAREPERDSSASFRRLGITKPEVNPEARPRRPASERTQGAKRLSRGQFRAASLEVAKAVAAAASGKRVAVDVIGAFALERVEEGKQPPESEVPVTLLVSGEDRDDVDAFVRQVTAQWNGRRAHVDFPPLRVWVRDRRVARDLGLNHFHSLRRLPGWLAREPVRTLAGPKTSPRVRFLRPKLSEVLKENRASVLAAAWFQMFLLSSAAAYGFVLYFSGDPTTANIFFGLFSFPLYIYMHALYYKLVRGARASPVRVAVVSWSAAVGFLLWALLFPATAHLAVSSFLAAAIVTFYSLLTEHSLKGVQVKSDVSWNPDLEQQRREDNDVEAALRERMSKDPFDGVRKVTAERTSDGTVRLKIEFFWYSFHRTLTLDVARWTDRTPKEQYLKNVAQAYQGRITQFSKGRREFLLRDVPAAAAAALTVYAFQNRALQDEFGDSEMAEIVGVYTDPLLRSDFNALSQRLNGFLAERSARRGYGNRKILIMRDTYPTLQGLYRFLPKDLRVSETEFYEPGFLQENRQAIREAYRKAAILSANPGLDPKLIVEPKSVLGWARSIGAEVMVPAMTVDTWLEIKRMELDNRARLKSAIEGVLSESDPKKGDPNHFWSYVEFFFLESNRVNRLWVEDIRAQLRLLFPEWLISSAPFLVRKLFRDRDVLWIVDSEYSLYEDEGEGEFPLKRSARRLSDYETYTSRLQRVFRNGVPQVSEPDEEANLNGLKAGFLLELMLDTAGRKGVAYEKKVEALHLVESRVQGMHNLKPVFDRIFTSTFFEKSYKSRPDIPMLILAQGLVQEGVLSGAEAQAIFAYVITDGAPAPPRGPSSSSGGQPGPRSGAAPPGTVGAGAAAAGAMRSARFMDSDELRRAWRGLRVAGREWVANGRERSRQTLQAAVPVGRADLDADLLPLVEGDLLSRLQPVRIGLDQESVEYFARLSAVFAGGESGRERLAGRVKRLFARGQAAAWALQSGLGTRIGDLAPGPKVLAVADPDSDFIVEAAAALAAPAQEGEMAVIVAKSEEDLARIRGAVERRLRALDPAGWQASLQALAMVVDPEARLDGLIHVDFIGETLRALGWEGEFDIITDDADGLMESFALAARIYELISGDRALERRALEAVTDKYREALEVAIQA